MVVTGDPGDPRTQALAEAVLAHPDLATLLLRGGTGRVPPDHPAAGPAAGKGLVEGQPAAYVCRAGRCGLPLTSPVLLRRALARPAGTPVT
ncbi:hypothetical protein [Roseicella frigidaeris]|uniref:hypothetical protein n=1 Tax=Roseicella frigidaeris TaxID=2230885 RepID=UPI000FDDFEA1|nr:hypothetical protein [Roseicella frigidaeris]